MCNISKTQRQYIMFSTYHSMDIKKKIRNISNLFIDLWNRTGYGFEKKKYNIFSKYEYLLKFIGPVKTYFWTIWAETVTLR